LRRLRPFVGKLLSSLGASTGGDWPNVFDPVSADRIEMIIEVNGGVAVRREKFQAILELDFPAGVDQLKNAVLIACPAKANSANVLDLWRERFVSSKGLKSPINSR